MSKNKFQANYKNSISGNLCKLLKELVQKNQAFWLIHILKCEPNGNTTFYFAVKVGRPVWLTAV